MKTKVGDVARTRINIVLNDVLRRVIKESKKCADILLAPKPTVASAVKIRCGVWYA